MAAIGRRTLRSCLLMYHPSYIIVNKNSPNFRCMTLHPRQSHLKTQFAKNMIASRTFSCNPFAGVTGYGQ